MGVSAESAWAGLFPQLASTAGEPVTNPGARDVIPDAPFQRHPLAFKAITDLYLHLNRTLLYQFLREQRNHIEHDNFVWNQDLLTIQVNPKLGRKVVIFYCKIFQNILIIFAY